MTRLNNVITRIFRTLLIHESKLAGFSRLSDLAEENVKAKNDRRNRSDSGTLSGRAGGRARHPTEILHDARQAIVETRIGTTLIRLLIASARHGPLMALCWLQGSI